MKIIDRYISSRFLSIFFFILFLFSLIAVAIDTSEKIDKFIESGLTVGEIFGQYFYGYILFINFLIWPLYVLITAIYLSSRLGKNNEILAILNGGISFDRILVSFGIGAFLLFGFHLFANHYVVPSADKKRVAFEAKFINKRKTESQNFNSHFMLSADSKVYVRSFNPRDSVCRDVRLEEFAEDDSLHRLWEIKTMEPIDSVDFGWRLKDYSIRTFDGENEDLKIYRNGKKDTLLNLTPGDFSYTQEEERGLSTPALLDRLKLEKKKGSGRTLELKAEVQRRWAEPFMDLILTILAVCIASRKVRGGLGLHLTVGIILGALFVVVSRFAKIFALSGAMSVGLGMWLPNIMFSLLTIWFYKNAQK